MTWLRIKELMYAEIKLIMSDILKAIYNLDRFNELTLNMNSRNSSLNRMNQMGEALEDFVKDIFADTCGLNAQEKINIHSQVFSYFGNTNNPPDFILKNSDAFEVKKIIADNSQLALNSSYPKDLLYRDDSRISAYCKNCEEYDWKTKNIFYVVGTVPPINNILKSLWIVDGRCYSANREIYTKYSDLISQSLRSISDIEVSETNELGRVNKADPLGITYLRIRGMWGIDHPSKVYAYLKLEPFDKFNLYGILPVEKYESFSIESKQQILSIDQNRLRITDEKIRNPNNPADLMKVKFIHYGF